MKQLALFLSLPVIIFVFNACEQELKEHPIPPGLKEEMERKINASQTGKQVSGSITISDKQAKPVPKEATLFIFARPEGVKQGPPLAVKRFSLVSFPFEYHIGQADTMLEGSIFDGKLEITARLDLDGNRKSSPGDLQGVVPTQAGDKDVNIVLELVTE